MLYSRAPVHEGKTGENSGVSCISLLHDDPSSPRGRYGIVVSGRGDHVSSTQAAAPFYADLTNKVVVRRFDRWEYLQKL